jgi:hypothetical protein
MTLGKAMLVKNTSAQMACSPFYETFLIEKGKLSKALKEVRIIMVTN